MSGFVRDARIFPTDLLQSLFFRLVQRNWISVCIFHLQKIFPSDTSLESSSLFEDGVRLPKRYIDRIALFSHRARTSQFSRDATGRESSPVDTMMLPRVAELGITLGLTAAVVGSNKVQGSPPLHLSLPPACIACHDVLYFLHKSLER